MATNFPTSLDTLTNPTATDTLDSPPHDTQHADANDAIEALQAKVGVDSSAVTTSLDYRVGQLEAGGSGVMNTSSTAPSSPSDGDMWYDTDDGRTYVYYDDGTSQQWVEFGAPPVQHGKILQVVSTTKTDTFSTTSTSYTDVTGLSVTITPTSATSNILVMYDVATSQSTVTTGLAFQMVRDSTAIGGGTAAGSRISASKAMRQSSGYTNAVSGSHLDSPATTSATTYKVQMIVPSGMTGYVNRSSPDSNDTNPNNARTSSTITVWEVSA